MASHKRPVLVFFNEVRPGDIKKWKMESNIRQSGGGARDLRMPKGYAAKIAPMFPKPSSKTGVKNADVFWLEGDGKESKTSIYLWRPTDVRPQEARIGRIYNIDSWEVSEDEYGEDRKKGQKWFYLLVLDGDGKLWARTLLEKNLSGEDESVRKFIKKRIAETPAHQSVRGVIDFDSGEVYPK